MVYGVSRGNWSGLALALAGGGLAYRGKTGHCPVYEQLGISSAVPGGTELALEDSITINRPVEDVYRFYRSFENLPRFMKHLAMVTPLGHGRSHWVVRLPASKTLEWDAQIVEDREYELIRWRSLEGSDIDHHGEIRFQKAPGDRGTEVRVVWKYHPPAAAVGALFAKLAEVVTRSTLQEELRRFKQIMEAGELATIDGQTSGRASFARSGAGRRGAERMKAGAAQPAKTSRRDLTDDLIQDARDGLAEAITSPGFAQHPTPSSDTYFHLHAPEEPDDRDELADEEDDNDGISRGPETPPAPTLH